MASFAGNSSIIRFGLFELDLQARELRKSGIRIKLQDQPFQILAALLERPGEIVTREDLQKRLWPADTFVDFDLSLNSAVKKLRLALNDDSDNPRFIETLYRRGYRFIGPVNGAVTGMLQAQPALPESELTPLLVPQPSLAPAASSNRVVRWKKFILWGTAIVLLAVLAALWLTPQKPIRVLGFTQITHDGRPKAGIVTDGDRLYFQEIDGDRFVIAQVSASGGETSIVSTPFANVGIGDVAPDGSALLIASFKGTGSARGFWSLPLPAGPPRRISDSEVMSAAWSPDGGELVFSEGQAVYLAKNDGTDRHKIASSEGYVGNLRFSPDGRKIRFDVSDPRIVACEIWEMNRNGTGMHSLLPGWNQPPLDCCGNWTRDGRYYVFQSFRQGSNNIWVVGRRFLGLFQSEPVQLTNGPLDFSFPVPSRDGRKIFLFGAQPRTELLRFDAKLGLVPYAHSLSATDLAFSPDGKWVAYVSVPERTLWRSRVDGSEPLQLTPTSVYAGLPRWSPDGQRIVFMGRSGSTNYHAYIVSANAGEPREVAPGAEAGFDPAFSPDGKSIILTLSYPTFAAGGISIVDLASAKVSKLPGSEDTFSPRWSPDAKYIAAITLDSEKLKLFEVATQTWTDLSPPTIGAIGFPSWSRDGAYLYFDTTFTDDPGFFRIHIADRKLEKLFSLKGMRRFRAEFGPWTGLDPDDSPLLARDISSQEIYALDWVKP